MTDFGTTTHPVAAKDHRCIWCGETITKGEKHAHFAGKWEGDFQNWRMHSECYTASVDGGDLQDGFMPYDHPRPALGGDARPQEQAHED